MDKINIKLYNFLNTGLHACSEGAKNSARHSRGSRHAPNCLREKPVLTGSGVERLLLFYRVVWEEILLRKYI